MPSRFIDLTSMSSSQVKKLSEQITYLTDINENAIFGSGRTKDVVLARQLFMWAACILFGKNYSVVGGVLDRDHNTVYYGMRVIEKAPPDSPAFLYKNQLIQWATENNLIVPQREFAHKISPNIPDPVKELFRLAALHQIPLREVARRAGLNPATLCRWASSPHEAIQNLEISLRAIGYRLAVVPIE